LSVTREGKKGIRGRSEGKEGRRSETRGTRNGHHATRIPIRRAGAPRYKTSKN